MRAVRIFSLGGKLARGHVDKGKAKGSAKVQIGAELLCKSAKVKPTSGDG
jgi:hypothetical protein